MKIPLAKKVKYYYEYCSAEQANDIDNNIESYKKLKIEKAKKAFNDPNIKEMGTEQHDRDTNTFRFWYKSSVEKKLNIPMGLYDLISDYDGTFLEKEDTNSVQILPINTELNDIFNGIDFTKKNNILIYGSPGNGKTQSIIDLVNNNPEMIFIKINKIDSLSYLKYIEDNIKKVLIFEEFTETVNSSDKKKILNFLDGMNSVQNCISIMSTNYPKELEPNIIDRPSRVRYFIEYKNPSETQINIICNHFNVSPDFFLKKDYSVDNIMNIIKTSKETNISLEQAETSIKSKRKFLSETFKGGLGV